MHPRILGSRCVAPAILVAALAAHAQTAPPARCRAANAIAVERFISAECAACWTNAPAAAASEEQWAFDWIVPSSRGDEAPLSPAAPSEAGERVLRATREPLADGASRARQWRLARPAPVRMRVVSSPAWKGYYALQLDVRGSVPRASTAWLALVESVPAGTDGTPVPRELVRSVVGPIDLAELRRGGRSGALHALRWPETSQPERLRGRAWIETPGGALLAVTDERCNPPR